MTLDDLLKLAKAPRRIEAVPAGDGTVYVRGLSAADVEEAAELAEKDGKTDVRPYVLATALCDEDGNPLCGEIERHAEALGDLPAALVRRLYAAMDRASDVKPGTVGDLTKNSQGRGDGSGTE